MKSKLFLVPITFLVVLALIGLSSCDNPFADDDEDDGVVVVSFSGDGRDGETVSAVALPAGTVFEDVGRDDVDEDDVLAGAGPMTIENGSAQIVLGNSEEWDDVVDPTPITFSGGTNLVIAIWLRDDDGGSPVNPIVNRAVKIDGNVTVTVTPGDF